MLVIHSSIKAAKFSNVMFLDADLSIKMKDMLIDAVRKGTGSKAKVKGIDISGKALNIAFKNSRNLGFTSRAKFYKRIRICC